MKDLRVLFMGTPEFAVHILSTLVDKNYNIVGVVTTPDKPSGRGQKVHASAVKKYALENDLKILQPINLKAEEFQKQLQELNPNVSIVVAFRMLPKKVWHFPAQGTFNLHASLLPDYRGAAPINWAIINGETKTGVTTFFLDEKIDTGKIIMQDTVEIKREDNAGSLHDKLMYKGAELVDQTLQQIATSNVRAIAQSENNKPKQAPKLNQDNTRIDWHQNMMQIYNHIRGLSPYPTAWTIFINGKKEMRTKIYGSEIERTPHKLETGKLIKNKKELKIAVEGGFIHLKEIQLPGKRKMRVDQLLNGLHLKENASMQ